MYYLYYHFFELQLAFNKGNVRPHSNAFTMFYTAFMVNNFGIFMLIELILGRNLGAEILMWYLIYTLPGILIILMLFFGRRKKRQACIERYNGETKQEVIRGRVIVIVFLYFLF